VLPGILMRHKDLRRDGCWTGTEFGTERGRDEPYGPWIRSLRAPPNGALRPTKPADQSGADERALRQGHAYTRIARRAAAQPGVALPVILLTMTVVVLRLRLPELAFVVIADLAGLGLLLLVGIKEYFK